jgi:DNA-binding MarR family transcriptional regulator
MHDGRHIGQLLRDARDDFLRRMNERRMFEPTAAIMTPAQDLVLQYLDEDGTPVEVLLERTGLPPAALHAIVTETAAATDYLELRDGVLRYTDLGRSQFATVRRTQAAIEEAYRHRLGAVRYVTLRETLADLAPRPDLNPSPR